MKKQKPRIVPVVADTQVKDIKSLQSEITRMQAQLKQESLRADAYEGLINVSPHANETPA